MAEVAYEKGLTFEKVWELIRELRDSQKDLRDSQKELRDSQKETDRQMKETDRQMKETDRQIKEINKRHGDFFNRFGEMVEYMIVPNLVAKFRELGFTFTQAAQNKTIEDEEHNLYAETDAFLENGDKVMIVEIKNKPTTEHVREHIQRMEKMRVYADLHNDKRQYLGSIAGVVMTKNVKDYALKNGFFVIEPSGETFSITVPEGGSKPKAW